MLIDRIYEASVIVERWPDILQEIADLTGAKGMAIISRSPENVELIVSPKIQDDANAFIAEGWGADVEFTRPLFTEQWPGFRSETAYRTAEEIAALPVHAKFLDPRGLYAGVGSVIQGAKDKALHIALEGFASHQAAQKSISFLDTLRPHLARGASITALHADRSQLVVDSLSLAGASAAVISASGRLRAANSSFIAKMANRMAETQTGLRFSDRILMQEIQRALSRHRMSRGGVQSIAIHGEQNEPPFAIHLAPILGAARDACGSDGVLLLIAEAANLSIPNADLLRLLYDLTPAEGRLARGLLNGHAVETIASNHNVSEGTVRTQLKAVFAKTGVKRQPELIRLLSGLGSPSD